MSDALGSSLALADSAGVIQTQYTYGPFGATSATGAASSNEFQYTGRENDGTGAYYYRARYYSPTLQRFISKDPASFAGGINQYAYVGDNPVNWTDGMGLWSPRHHDFFFDRALGGLAPPEYIQKLKDCSRSFDKQTQSEAVRSGVLFAFNAQRHPEAERHVPEPR